MGNFIPSAGLGSTDASVTEEVTQEPGDLNVNIANV